jgi:hypothetical protein
MTNIIKGVGKEVFGGAFAQGMSRVLKRGGNAMILRKYSGSFVIMFVAAILIPGYSFAQAVVPVMTLADGTTVAMTSSQLTALASQPGITISATPTVTATQVAVPIPASLGGGFIVAEPEALAAGLNAVGITTGATAVGVAGATAATGSITAGASVAGATAAAGVSTGTIAAGAAAAAIAIGIGVAAGSSGGGGTPTPSHH